MVSEIEKRIDYPQDHIFPPMSEDDAIMLFELLFSRITGWNVPLSIKSGMPHVDHRTSEAKSALELMKQTMMVIDYEETISLLMDGRSIFLQFPEHIRHIVVFQCTHLVPRRINEPTSDESIKQCGEYGNARRFPSWMIEFALPAAVEDHPEIPRDAIAAYDRQARKILDTRIVARKVASDVNVVPFKRK